MLKLWVRREICINQFIIRCNLRCIRCWHFYVSWYQYVKASEMCENYGNSTFNKLIMFSDSTWMAKYSLGCTVKMLLYVIWLVSKVVESQGFIKKSILYITFFVLLFNVETRELHPRKIELFGKLFWAFIKAFAINFLIDYTV